MDPGWLQCINTGSSVVTNAALWWGCSHTLWWGRVTHCTFCQICCDSKTALQKLSIKKNQNISGCQGLEVGGMTAYKGAQGSFWGDETAPCCNRGSNYITVCICKRTVYNKSEFYCILFILLCYTLFLKRF